MNDREHPPRSGATDRPPAAAAPSRNRRVVLGLGAAAFVIVGGLAWFLAGQDKYPCRASKGYGFGPALVDPPSSLPATPEAALRAFASSGAPSLTAEPIPAEGWVEYRGRWVHELPSGNFYEVNLTRNDNGWQVRDPKVCAP